jgi:hypothetical protein
MKFIQKFRMDLTCELEVPDVFPGSNLVFRCQWSRRPKQRDFAEYVQWMNLVMQECANKWDQKILPTYQLVADPSKFEIW